MSEQAWIVGIRLDPDDNQPTYYCVVFGDDLQPVTKDGYIVVCDELKQIDRVLQSASTSLTFDDTSRTEVCDVCDVAMALYLLESEETDEHRSVIDCINTLTDLVKGTGGILPAHLKSPLYRLADHMTFERTLGAFFRDSEYSREQAIEGIIWCVGWVLTHAHFVRSGRAS